MNKYYGRIGYVQTSESSQSIWAESFEFQSYYGDILKNVRRRDSESTINDTLKVNVRISIIADENLIQNAFNIKCAEYLGCLWTVTEIEVEHPRLILTLGDVYKENTEGDNTYYAE